MKRARGKNTYRYDDIDVPEMVTKNYERHMSEAKSRTKTAQPKRKPQTTSKSTTSNKPIAQKAKTSNKTNSKAVNKTVSSSRRKATSKKKTKKNKLSGILLFIVLVLIVLFLIMMGQGWGDNSEGGALIPVDMQEGKLNVLLLGVDEQGLRTDAMMLCSYDMLNTKAELISIPRDTQMRITDRGVIRKINEVHAMHDSDNNLLGPMGSIEAVQALTGVPIHYYLEFSFKAIDELADALGPIEFDVPDIEGNGKGMNYDDPYQDLHIHLKPGLQKLKGNQVQQFLRYRKSNGNTVDGSDLSRVQRQQEFLKAVVDQKVNIGLIAKLPSIYSKLKKNIKTNFTAGDIVKYAKYLNGLKSEDINTNSLPGDSKSTSVGWYFVCDLDETEELIETRLGYEVEELTNRISVKNITSKKEKPLVDKEKEDKNKEENDIPKEEESNSQNVEEEIPSDSNSSEENESYTENESSSEDEIVETYMEEDRVYQEDEYEPEPEEEEEIYTVPVEESQITRPAKNEDNTEDEVITLD